MTLEMPSLQTIALTFWGLVGATVSMATPSMARGGHRNPFFTFCKQNGQGAGNTMGWSTKPLFRFFIKTDAD